MRHIAIIGGGFTGTAVAIRLCAAVPAQLNITIVEPREVPGGGLAYGGDDPDHRVNGTHELLVLDPGDIGHFLRWYEAAGRSAQDPAARAASGVRYVRRSDVRRYMNDTLRETVATNAHGTAVHHLRDRAVAARRVGGKLRVVLASGRSIAPDLAVLALGGQRPSLPGSIPESVASRPGYVGDPFDSVALSAIPPDGAVLLLGTGLTTADVLASLSRNGHQGPITAISRRGLLPQPQGAAPDVAKLMQRLQRPQPRFIERHGEGLGLRAAFRALRRDMAAAVAEGRDVKGAFDDLRDASQWIWPGLDDIEKRRFLRHLKPWYDVNRYRMVPQTGATVAAMTASGQLTFRAARLRGLSVHDDGFEALLASRAGGTRREVFRHVINCTGPASPAAEPLVRSLCALGLARADSLGLGLDVDRDGRVLDADGTAQDALWAFGLLTRGRFGDMTAIPQIAFHLHRSLPVLVEAAMRAGDRPGCEVT